MKKKILNLVLNSSYQRIGYFHNYFPMAKPRMTIETCGVKNSAGVENFIRLMRSFKKWGWSVSKNKGHNKADFIIIHFRPVMSFLKCLPEIKKAKNNGSKVLLYVSEPLGLRKEVWKSHLLPLDIVIETFDICDVIIVNSIGYLYCSLYDELKRFASYLDKTVLIEESLLYELHSNLPVKRHTTSQPVAVWHGYPLNMSRWVQGNFPGDLYFDPQYFPSIYKKKESELYGNLYDTLEVPLITIAKYHPTIKADRLFPGDKNIGRLLQQYDIGIAPFFTNIFRTLIKPFGAKIQTYMIAGLPVIASPIPDYLRWIEHEKTGLFAESKKEWKEASQLLKDPKLRQYISSNARAMVLSNFSSDKIVGKYERVFEALKNNEKKIPFSILNFDSNIDNDWKSNNSSDRNR